LGGEGALENFRSCLRDTAADGFGCNIHLLRVGVI
jgi:hypothetical protein